MPNQSSPSVTVVNNTQPVSGKLGIHHLYVKEQSAKVYNASDR